MFFANAGHSNESALVKDTTKMSERLIKNGVAEAIISRFPWSEQCRDSQLRQ